MIYTLQYGTYIFPNQTFEIQGHPLSIDTPTYAIPRRDGGISLGGYLKPKKIIINGKVFGEDKDTVHQSMNILYKAVHNRGAENYLQYRSDRRVTASLSQEGINSVYEKGLYGHMFNLDIVMVMSKPYAEGTTENSASSSRNNASAVDTLTNAGNYPTNPIFTFIGGTFLFSNNLVVGNNANSNLFSFQGSFLAGQTLVIDCDAGCVLMHVGATMIDAISYISGDLFLALEEGNNDLVISGGTFSYSAVWRSRWYI